jgi:multiple sugar transport system permease protein
VSRRLTAVAVHGALVLGAAGTLLPLVWMLSASLMPTGEASAVPPHWLPSAPTLAHYHELAARLDLARAFANSLAIAVVTTAVSVTLNALAGYAFARFAFAGRDRIFALLLLALVIPGQLGMLPLFLMLRGLGLVNTYLGVLVPGLASIFGIFLVRQYALGIPQSVLDAARVDGAGELRVFWSVVVPLCRPVLVTLALFTFMGTWNDFLWPLIVLSDTRLQTLPVALANLLGEHVQDTELMMAGAVVTVLPVIAVFLALQRSYIEGIVTGSVKQ